MNRIFDIQWPSVSRILLSAFCWLVVSTAVAGPAREQLEAFIQDVDTFEANFEQTLYDEDSTPLQKSIGSVQIKRPGKFIWTYYTPDEQRIVADGGIINAGCAFGRLLRHNRVG